MGNYQIVTDSTSDLTPEMIAGLQLTVIPMVFQIGDHTYLNYADGRELGFHEFYEQLRAGKEATTAQINMTTFFEYFEPILQRGEDVLYLAFSSGLSGTCQAAGLAADEMKAKYPDRRVVVVDSLAASMGEGLLAYYAATKRQAGESLDEVAAWLTEQRNHLCHWFTVDDLNHLKRGGRVSPTVAFVGTLLGIKPVLHVDDEGHLIPLSKVRGRKQVLDALVERMAEVCTEPEGQTVFVSHGDAAEDAAYVAEKVKERFPVKDVYINFIGPVIGAHSGPGTVALFHLGEHK